MLRDWDAWCGAVALPFLFNLSLERACTDLLLALQSSSKALNPLLSLPDDADKLSDYVPGSNEVSRVPSRQPTQSDSEEEEEEEEEEEDDDGDMQMKGKAPSVLKREGAAKERKVAVSKKKEAKREMEDQVRLSLTVDWLRTVS